MTRSAIAFVGLRGLAAWIDEQLGDETADRQWIAESAAARVRDITGQMPGAAALERPAGPPASTGRYVQCEGPIEDYPPGRFVPEAERRGYLDAALAGVELGAYDRRILAWLAQWDDCTCRVVVSLIVRARRAAVAHPAERITECGCGYDDCSACAQATVLGQVIADAIQYRDPAGACADCEAIPPAAVPGAPGRLAPGLCDDHADDLNRTDAYLALARDLGIEVNDR